jgi:large conductance mechanosensitive channel
MALFDDFKKFAFKGNVVDLAVGVIIGASFQKIVSALVADLIMPVVALILPSGDWRESAFILKAAANPKDNVSIKYGDFAGNVLDFLIVAFVLFLIVSRIIKACPFCFETIPVKATRCKACTSTLPEKPETKPAPAAAAAT